MRATNRGAVGGLSGGRDWGDLKTYLAKFTKRVGTFEVGAVFEFIHIRDEGGQWLAG